MGAERLPKVVPGMEATGLGRWGATRDQASANLAREPDGAVGPSEQPLLRTRQASQQPVPFVLFGKAVGQRLCDVNRCLAFVKAEGKEDEG